MKKAFLIILCIIHGSLSFSQESYNRKVIKYSLKDGLSFGFINNIIQDDRGFMWFATGDGLNRFDGINFKVFRFDADNPYSLPNNHIQFMYKDKQGGIWITTRSGVYNFDANTERFVKFNDGKNKPGLSDDVGNMSSAGEYGLWFAAYNEGFFSYNKQTHTQYVYNKHTLPGIGNNCIVNAYQDTNNLLWVGSEDSVVAVYRVKNGVILQKEQQIPINLVPKGKINAIYEDHYHNVWIATSRGLAVYKRDENKIYIFNGAKYNLQSNYFFSLLEDSNNNLLIGLQDGGLYKLDLENAVKTNFKNVSIDPVKSEDNYNITQRTVQSLCVDRDKNVWAGTFGDGIFMISNVPEKFLKFQYQLTNKYGTSFLRYYGMCLDADGYLWIGSDGDGIYKKKLNGETVRHYYADGKKGSLTNNAILCAGVDHLKNLWFGSYAKGLFKYDRKNDQFINYAHNPNDPKSLCLNDVRVIFEDSAYNLWVGTNGGGISIMPNGKNNFINYTNLNNTVLNNKIMAICEDKKGSILVGTYGSGVLQCLKGSNQFVNYFTASQVSRYLPGKVVFSLQMYDKNKLIVGTEGDGLIVYNTDTKQIKAYTEKQGLASNNINALQADDEGNIWVSTNKGISKIEKGTGKIINYDTSDGLQTGQFNSNSVLYSPKDKFICFGGTEGYNIFFPHEVMKSTFKPPVIITGLQLFGKEVEIGNKDNILRENVTDSKQISLKADQSVFSIQYAALNYAYAEKSEFAYQLVGLDKGWSYVHNQKSATYRYLEPGDYVFKVKASNQDGIWFDDYASINIRILPPWYKTWWANLSYFLVAVGLIYYVLRYKANQQKLKYEIRVANMAAEKEKELNEKKLSFFTNISHEFRTPLTLIINPIKELLSNKDQTPGDLASMHVVYRNARRLLSLVDHLLLFRKADSGADKLKVVKLNLVSLCKEVFLCFNYQAKVKGIQFDFFCDTDVIEIYADREKIEIMLFNLLSNALKFTPTYGETSCIITQDTDRVYIQIKDSGCGIPAETGNQLFDKFFQAQNTSLSHGGFGIGLHLVKMFVNSHKGTIEYQNNEPVGTIFTVTLLKGKDHLGASFIFEDVAETSVFLEELMDNDETVSEYDNKVNNANENAYEALLNTRKIMLVVEDNIQIRQYIKHIFQEEFDVFEADNGTDGLVMVGKLIPSIVISDVMMDGLNGIELCSQIKENTSLKQIPVILLTASALPEMKLKGIEGGADDYITKPFEKEVLIARVNGLMKSREHLHKYFYNEITLQSNNLKIPADYKEFLEKCIKIVEQHLLDKDFCIKNLADETGMSHSNLYKKIKFISAGSANEFIRFIRLRKAAEILLNTDCTVAEAAYRVGINDSKYFREQFSKLFGLNPSNYVKKYRKSFRENLIPHFVKDKRWH